MEHYKISTLLKDSTVSKFVTKKWIEVNDLSSGQYSVNKNIRFKTSMLRSDLFDTYIIVKGKITVEGDDGDKNGNKELAFEKNAPFISCISKTNNKFISNSETLDIVMSMYNLLENSNNYSMTSESLRNYYRDEINDDENENVNNRIHNNKTITSTSFEFKTKLIGSTSDHDNILDTEVVVPLKF